MTRERLVREAEALFFTRGFQLVTLKEISSKLQIRPASLYHYFPGGKEDLYLEVIKCKTEDFENAVVAISSKHQELEPLLLEFGQWYMAQSPMNMMLIAEVDMPYLSPDAKRKVSACVGKSVFGALGMVFGRFGKHLRKDFSLDYLVGTLGVLLFSAHTGARKSNLRPNELIEQNIKLFLNGVLKG